MAPIPAVYENGIFRPMGPVTLPEHSRVEVNVAPLCRLPEISDADLKELRDDLFTILTTNGDTGESRVAEQHNEYRP